MEKSRAEKIKEEIQSLYAELHEIEISCKHGNIIKYEKTNKAYCKDCAQPVLFF